MQDDVPLFEPPQPEPTEVKTKALHRPIWTENKARLIERYLYYFVLVTKHGTYIDGFAGPQRLNEPEAWAARLVLESEPGWLRHFHLFDRDELQVARLDELRAAHPDRDVHVYHGNFNDELDVILTDAVVPQREATFCLIDQRTFECRWSTLERLAQFKQSGFKIELFYFFAQGWLGRALAATTAPEGIEQVEAWWGRDDWSTLRGMKGAERARLLCDRFRKELSYASAKAYAIFSREFGGTVMYFMVHATDHPGAPLLMTRAYEKAVLPREPMDQLALDFGVDLT